MSKEENFKLFCELRGQEVEGSVLEHEKYTINRGELTGFSQYDDDKPFQIGGHSWYRNIKPIKKPKLRPWKPEEVPFPCAVRRKNWDKGSWSMIGTIGPQLVTVSSITNITYKELLDHYEQHDGKPCGVMEEQGG